MKIIRRLIDYNSIEPLAISIGNFDGVHIAHQEVIKRSVNYAKNNNIKSAVITFSPHPLKYFGYDVKILTTERKKIELVEKLNIDYMFILDFGEVVSLPSDVFVEEVLLNKLHMAFIAVGFNYRFGKKNSGDVTLLKLFSKRYGFVIDVVDRVIINDMLVSSTNIRNLLLEGELELVNKMLGRFYSLEGNVISGKSIGKLLGFPTANIKTDNEVLPKFGVYAGRVKINKEYYPAAINIGRRPTVNDNFVCVEAHIIDFTGDLYDQFVEVELIRYIRGEKKFDDFQSLSNQIRKDVTTILDILKSEKLR
ncbi:MAG: bifunctional riboflavin kinase/FAD synthetase [Deferribacterota bacterium]|nr:bifunctional riboflavin kinase/FAD synthetase [Deferribacterota bacterium]